MKCQETALTSTVFYSILLNKNFEIIDVSIYEKFILRYSYRLLGLPMIKILIKVYKNRIKIERI